MWHPDCLSGYYIHPRRAQINYYNHSYFIAITTISIITIIIVIIISIIIISVIILLSSTIHPVSITRFPLSRFSPGAGLLRYVFFTLSTVRLSRGWVRKDGNLVMETGCTGVCEINTHLDVGCVLSFESPDPAPQISKLAERCPTAASTNVCLFHRPIDIRGDGGSPTLTTSRTSVYFTDTGTIIVGTTTCRDATSG